MSFLEIAMELLPQSHGGHPIQQFAENCKSWNHVRIHESAGTIPKMGGNACIISFCGLGCTNQSSINPRMRKKFLNCGQPRAVGLLSWSQRTWSQQWIISRHQGMASKQPHVFKPTRTIQKQCLFHPHRELDYPNRWQSNVYDRGSLMS
jgi:hypothetical protein